MVAAESETQIVSINPPSEQQIGQDYVVSVLVTGEEPTGDVNVSDGDGNSCQITLVDGLGSCTLNSSSVGQKFITAEYLGDDDNDPSSVEPVPYEIVKADPELAIVSHSAGNFEVAGIPYTVEITLGGYQPSGNVEVNDGNGASCTIELPATSCELTSTEIAEEVVLSAVFSEDANNNGDSDSVLIEIVSSGSWELSFSTSPTLGIAGGPLLPGVVVQVLDSVGNLVEDDNVTQVTVSLETNPTGAALSGTRTMTVTGGEAHFTNLSIDLVGEGYRLQVTDAEEELFEDQSAFFNVVLDGVFSDRFED